MNECVNLCAYVAVERAFRAVQDKALFCNRTYEEGSWDVGQSRPLMALLCAGQSVINAFLDHIETTLGITSSI